MIEILATIAVKQLDITARTHATKQILFRTVPFSGVSQTKPRPGTEPMAPTLPAQPIEGDSQADPGALLEKRARSATAFQVDKLRERAPAAVEPGALRHAFALLAARNDCEPATP